MSKGSDDELPKVWSDLMWAIADRESLRELLPKVDPNAPPEPPYEFHGFEVTAWVLGGMGMVLLGRDPKLDRKVALKLLQSSGEEADAALIAEAQTLAKLSHPNVVTIYGVSEWEGGVFFEMEFVEGMNGQQWLKEDRPWPRVLAAFIDAGRGLAAAHAKGIQHGDFKPANILIGTDGRTLVADFGIADYLRSDDNNDPRPTPRAGTVAYMAPERLRGYQGDARSDQYSFCASLWRGLHGARPYYGWTVATLLEAIEADDLQPPELDPEVPRWLTEVVHKGLAADPDQRYRDMNELLSALTGGSDDESANDEPGEDDDPTAHEGRFLHTPARPARAARRRWGYVAAALCSALAVLSVDFLMRSLVEPERAAEMSEPEPFTLILGLIGADEFTQARQMQWRHASKLTDVQALQIARDWLSRARQRAGSDRAKAKLAASAALQLAGRVQREGRTAESKQVAGQLAAEAKIYELIAADEFAEAQQTWLAHESDLTDEQSLQLAGDCLERAEQLVGIAHETACAAAMMARDVADETAVFGATDKSKDRGGRLGADVTAFLVNHPVCPY